MEIKFKRNAYDKVKEAIENKQTAILFGLRRLGKTTILMQLKEEYENAVYIDWSEFQNKGLSDLDFYNKLDDLAQKHDLLLFDEIQERTSWDQMLFSLWNKYTYHDKIKIVATGSSSLLMSPKELGLDRSKRIHISTLSFSEFCKLTGKNKTNENFEYFLGRGFPGFARYDFEQHGFNKLLEEVLTPIFEEDIARERPKIKSHKLIKLLIYLGERVSGELNIEKTSHILDIDRKAIYDYLNIFEKSNILRRVYKVNEKGKQKKYKKFKAYLNPHFYIWINKQPFTKLKKTRPELIGHIIEAYWIFAQDFSTWWLEYYYLQNEKHKQKEIDFVKLSSQNEKVFEELHEIKYQNELSLSKTNLFMVQSDNRYIWNKKCDLKDGQIKIKSLLDL